jgi:NADH-quinone oxidoreductase subunit H
MKFAYFFLAEFINMFIVASIAVTVFFGGWLSPFGITDEIFWLQPFWFFAKVFSYHSLDDVIQMDFP